MLKEWSVYIIEAENGFFYTGITKDLKRRFLEHTVTSKSAKFFRTSPAKKIVFSRKGFSYSEALKEEWRIKKLSRLQKLKLIRSRMKGKS
jgi:putative endonuclease